MQTKFCFSSSITFKFYKEKEERIKTKEKFKNLRT